MNAEARSILAETHLNDLQADIEAGSRKLADLHETATELREALIERRVRSALMSALLKQIGALRKTVAEQQAIVRQLRHDIRRSRNNAHPR